MSLSHESATTIEQAVDRLVAAGMAGRAVAGGTDVMGVLKDRVHATPLDRLVDLKPIDGLDGIEERDGHLVIGALARIADLESSGVVERDFAALHEAAHAIASPQIRNMGTVGGNICQEPRCWYYRLPGNGFFCTRKGGRFCNALTGENRYHSVLGSAQVQMRPCTEACPGEIAIPEYMELMRAGDVDGAARRLLERNPLPSITGRVCPHTCQKECNRGLYDESVGVRSVERYLGDVILERPELLGTAPPESGMRVAVIGSGPAGLSAAYYLRLQGHGVTLLERQREAGGMLRYGIPAYRLPREVLDTAIARLLDLGIDLDVCCEVGFDDVASGDKLTLSQLSESFDAVCIASGAWDVPRIGLEGEDELLSGIEFLKAVAEGNPRVPGQKLVVIGGGNVAVDVATTARRLGAERVIMACLETCEEMPALLEEVDEALAEGIELIPSCGPARLLRDGDRIGGIELVRCTSCYDENACFAPRFDEGDRWTIEADEVILAVGQRVESDALESAGIELQGGRATVDASTGETSLRGVFAGGDVVTGPATVIAALAAGRKIARSIHAHLNGSGSSFSAVPNEVEELDGRESAVLGQSLQTFDSGCLTHSLSVPIACRPTSRRSVSDEDTCTIADDLALNEARRCFNCGCVAVAPSDLAPVLVALDACVVTTQRSIPAEQFFAARPGASTVLRAGELVREVQVPLGKDSRRSSFVKYRQRKTIDFAIVSVCAVLTCSGDTVRDARIVLGAAAPVPVRLRSGEALLVGHTLNELCGNGLSQSVADSLVEGVRPLALNAYKVSIAKALIADALTDCANQEAFA